MKPLIPLLALLITMPAARAQKTSFAPDLIIFNAAVRTMDETRPQAEAIAISGNRIAAVGTTKEIRALAGPQTRQVDALNRRVWQYRPPVGDSIVATQFHPADGTLSALVAGRTILRMDPACTTRTYWSPESDRVAGDIAVDVPGFHHEAVFEEDLARSRRVTYVDWARRPWQEKAVEKISAIFASQM